MSLQITWVAGATGAGKTTWIRDHIDSLAVPCAYWHYAADAQSIEPSTIDATYLSYVCPGLRILRAAPSHGELAKLAEQVQHLLIELPSDIDRATLPELTATPAEYLWIQASNLAVDVGWASRTIAGGHGSSSTSPSQSIDLTGEILDPPSLAMLWTEITQGAYGEVQRAKALLETIEGYPLYFDYVAGSVQTDYEELEITRNLQGRPQRFSGLSIIGEVNHRTLQQSLKDASLDDRLIEYYQSQIQSMLQSPSVS
ncbi:hypothetical protein IQ266_04010 [filamentous cyanobacterium LEGE 11480]|uniref:GTPase, G3E family protein n=1 Tax=Romeriopsis navalis LEGE 11480 TaxID=2777977 RepID=A0A928VHY2_9CYAN|nr:TGBp1 family protein [Romeriopsis navalis]MBE9028926.1 hypothetical protein [Romeriopsis navalis LEGE 11480]